MFNKTTKNATYQTTRFSNTVNYQVIKTKKKTNVELCLTVDIIVYSILYIYATC